MKALRTWAIPLFITAYFLALTVRAVSTYFSPDDTMNIYQSWYEPSIAPIIKANLLFFRPSAWPRPLAQLWLRLMFDAAGFHPAPFKIVNLAILIANIFLTYTIARRLAGSRTAAGVTTLLIAYHGQAADLYFNTGYIFDVLCYFFYFAAALVYVRARQQRRFPHVGELIAICLLYIAALNSKELAVTFPVFLLLYELVAGGSAEPPGPQLSRLDSRRWLGILLTGAITLAVIFGRILKGTLAEEAAYTPVMSVAQFMRTSVDFAGKLFCHPGRVRPATLLILWIVMFVMAWFTRSKALRFAWLFLMIAPLPVAFIDSRGLPQYYIPLFGWALYAGVLINLVLSMILGRIRPMNLVRTRIYASALTIAILTAILYPVWRSYPDQAVAVSMEGEEYRSIVRQLHRLVPVLHSRDSNRPARVLFVDDPIRADWWNLTFLARLSYRDRNIYVERAKNWPLAPTGNQLASYDKVFDYRAGYFYLLAPPWRSGFAPAVVIEWGRPQIFHEGWSLVTRENPARPNEVVMLKASDLGDTLPPLAPGETFPADPLARVLSNVRVNVSALSAPVQLKVGWPEERTYRVDIRIPPNTPRGMVWMDVTANGVTGPAVEFPVK